MLDPLPITRSSPPILRTCIRGRPATLARTSRINPPRRASLRATRTCGLRRRRLCCKKWRLTSRDVPWRATRRSRNRRCSKAPRPYATGKSVRSVPRNRAAPRLCRKLVTGKLVTRKFQGQATNISRGCVLRRPAPTERVRPLRPDVVPPQGEPTVDVAPSALPRAPKMPGNVGIVIIKSAMGSDGNSPPFHPVALRPEASKSLDMVRPVATRVSSILAPADFVAPHVQNSSKIREPKKNPTDYEKSPYAGIRKLRRQRSYAEKYSKSFLGTRLSALDKNISKRTLNTTEADASVAKNRPLLPELHTACELRGIAKQHARRGAGAHRLWGL